MDPREIAEQIWPARQAEIEPLGGGITNHNYKVLVDGAAYVIRIGGRDTELLGIDRGAEREASESAAALGIGPEVVAFVDGCLVTRFLDGEKGRAGAVETGVLLRSLHEGPPLAAVFDPFRVVEAYAATASARGVAPPPAYGRARELGARIEQRSRRPALRPCHNDLLAANFVHDGERLWLVDWEYAGMGDPYFDLANFAVNNGLDADGERALLHAYGGGDPDALALMRFMSDFREAMWGVVQQGISELDVDFRGYAEEHFERLERTAADPRFRQALTGP
ncbi:MAG: phosphotransferase [Gaiellaceae bacterium]